jgi:hypothetical protein
MPDAADLNDLIGYLSRTGRLTSDQAARLIDELVAFFDESAEEFIRRRHLELQQEGHRNSEIFARIREEASRRRFRAPAYTGRQIRRIVYG